MHMHIWLATDGPWLQAIAVCVCVLLSQYLDDGEETKAENRTLCRIYTIYSLAGHGCHFGPTSGAEQIQESHCIDMGTHMPMQNAVQPPLQLPIQPSACSLLFAYLGIHIYHGGPMECSNSDLSVPPTASHLHIRR